MLSNIGGEKLDQYLQIYFSLQMGMSSLGGFDNEQDEEETKDSGAGYDMNMMPSIAYMMQNLIASDEASVDPYHKGGNYSN